MFKSDIYNTYKFNNKNRLKDVKDKVGEVEVMGLPNRGPFLCTSKKNSFFFQSSDDISN